MLLLAGLYPALISAVSAPDIKILALFIGGGAVGILVMAHVLKALFARYRIEALSCLTGVVFGALVRVWPWQGTGDDGSISLLIPTVDVLWGPLGLAVSGFVLASLALRLSARDGI